MDDLIARLEAATEGNRELDAEIALFLGWTYGKLGSDRKPWWRRPGQIKDYQRSSDTWASQWPNMEWTSSIDAALTLVPDTHDWQVRFQSNQDADVANARLWKPRDPCGEDAPPDIWANAWTPPLALCIAALKARNEAKES